jgi:hypothetical protein
MSAYSSCRAVTTVPHLAVADLLDDHRTLFAGVGADLAERLFESLSDDPDTSPLVVLATEPTVQQLLGLEQHDPTAGDAPFMVVWSLLTVTRRALPSYSTRV